MTLGVFDVIDLMTGYQQAATLTAAARLGVFDALTDRSLTWQELADELGTHPTSTRSLCDALAALELLALDEAGRFQSTPIAERLTHDGDLRLVAEKEAFLARIWLDLDSSIRSGTPQLDAWRNRLVADPAQARQFLEALIVLARETGPDLVALLNITGDERIADLGGGLGSYAVPLASAGSAVTLVELDPVTTWAREAIAVHGDALAERIDIRGVDILGDDADEQIGADFDVVLLSHLLHDLTDDDALATLRVAASIARPGGRVVVFELPGDPPGAFGPLFDLMMRVETPGSARRIDELAALMSAAGLTDVAEVDGARRPHGILQGIKR